MALIFGLVMIALFASTLLLLASPTIRAGVYDNGETDPANVYASFDFSLLDFINFDKSIASNPTFTWNLPNNGGSIVYQLYNSALLKTAVILVFVAIACVLVSFILAIVLFFTRKKLPDLPLIFAILGAISGIACLIISVIGHTDIYEGVVSASSGINTANYDVRFAQLTPAIIWDVLLLVGNLVAVAFGATSVELLNTEE
jgi:hypothetical protein